MVCFLQEVHRLFSYTTCHTDLLQITMSVPTCLEPNYFTSLFRLYAFAFDHLKFKDQNVRSEALYFLEFIVYNIPYTSRRVMFFTYVCYFFCQHIFTVCGLSLVYTFITCT